jgi:hypothetical protein
MVVYPELSEFPDWARPALNTTALNATAGVTSTIATTLATILGNVTAT